MPTIHGEPSRWRADQRQIAAEIHRRRKLTPPSRHSSAQRSAAYSLTMPPRSRLHARPQLQAAGVAQVMRCQPLVAQCLRDFFLAGRQTFALRIPTNPRSVVAAVDIEATVAFARTVRPRKSSRFAVSSSTLLGRARLRRQERANPGLSSRYGCEYLAFVGVRISASVIARGRERERFGFPASTCSAHGQPMLGKSNFVCRRSIEMKIQPGKPGRV